MGEYPTDPAGGAGRVDGAAAGGAVAMGLTPLAYQYLHQTRPWVRFMSIVTFLAAALMVVMGGMMLLVGVFGGLAARSSGAAGAAFHPIVAVLLALFYVALAVVYVMPGLYLARYAKAIGLLKTDGAPSALEDALKQQKSFWRFVGITTAIGVVVAVVGMILAILVGIFAVMMGGRA